MGEIEGKRVAFLVANEGIEQVELTGPWDAVRSAGGHPELLAPQSGVAQAMHHLDKGDTFQVDRTVSQADVTDYIGLVLPGGVANPDQLRTDRDAVSFVTRMFGLHKPVAAICHGPWTIVEADAVRGRTLTSWPSLRTDVINAGGAWVDEEVVVCRSGPNVLVTSRKPDDLNAFCEEFLGVLLAAGGPDDPESPETEQPDRPAAGPGYESEDVVGSPVFSPLSPVSRPASCCRGGVARQVRRASSAASAMA